MIEKGASLGVGTRVGDSVIEELIGQPGEVSVTYRARSERHGLVALKELFPAALVERDAAGQLRPRSAEHAALFEGLRQSFRSEAQLLAGLHHPAIMQVYDSFDADGTAYCVMEYCPGETLERHLVHAGRLPEESVLDILGPIAEGLSLAHRQGFIHRDLRLDHIVLRPEGGPVLIDFGAPRQRLRAAQQWPPDTLAQGYAGPECGGAYSARQGPRTDIYALAAIAYRAAIGRRPVDATERLAGAAMVPAAEAGADQCSAAFLAAIDWGLQLDPERRPQRVEDWFLALLGQAQTPPVSLGTPARPPQAPPPEMPATAPGRRSPLAAAAVALLALAAVAAFWMLRPASVPAPPALAARSVPSVAPSPAAPSEPAPEALAAGSFASGPKLPEAPAASESLLIAPSLDQLAQQLLQQEDQARARDAQERQQLERQIAEEEKRLRVEQARRRPEPVGALTKPSTGAPTARPGMGGPLDTPEAQAAVERAERLERELAQLKAEREERLRREEQERLAATTPNASSALAPVVDGLRPAGCRLWLPDLFGPNRMNYDHLSRLAGVTRNADSGVLITPPIKVDTGGTVILEVRPNGCVKTRDLSYP